MKYLTLFFTGVAAGLVLVLLMLITIKDNKTQVATLRNNKRSFVITTIAVSLLMGGFVSGMTFISSLINL